ncbi:MAG: endolytic transglycosylase MltG [Desulfovibrionaceae bacterium]|nr:endolytic transglycosylase MltG [Desulfovibrionaceae bacterium]
MACLALASAALMLAGSWFVWRAWDFLYLPPEDPGQEKIFVIEPGQTFLSIARGLERERLVKDADKFLALAEEKNLTSRARAGEFELSTGWLPERTLEVITRTPGVMARVVVREGLTWWQTAEAIAQAGLVPAQDFGRAAHNAGLLSEYDIPADSAEGYLFPETYLLTRPRNDPGPAMVRTMLDEFAKNARKVWPLGLPGPEKLHKTVILASLVEKETGDASERARIAGVFANRLKKGIALAADPSVIYGLGPDFNGNLKKGDLADKTNPYNTYQRPGLPKGPICSPGLDSLLAAANPEKHDFYYFVAKGDGSHHFSRTLKEHNQAVVKYQIKRDRNNYRSTKK